MPTTRSYNAKPSAQSYNAKLTARSCNAIPLAQSCNVEPAAQPGNVEPAARLSQKGFTLVEIIVSFAILAIVAVSIAGVFVAISGIQLRDDQMRSDSATVQGQIAAGEDPTSSSSGSLPLGDYTIDVETETYNSGIGSYTILNSGTSRAPNNAFLDGDEYYVGEYTVMRTGYYKLEVWGASGGYSTGTYSIIDGRGGYGGYSVGTVKLNAGDVLYLHAGMQGGYAVGGVEAGPNGGGASGAQNQRLTGGGGDASDIRLNEDSLYNRIIVAGGGGGSGANYSSGSANNNGGAGGGLEGGTNTVSGTIPYSTGRGGSQTAGGANGNTSSNIAAAGFGVGGSHIKRQNNYPGGGGGGGWYGGGAGGSSGGGGGSSYVLTETSARPEGYAFGTDTQYNFVDYKLVNGTSVMPDPRKENQNMTGMCGNGYVRISWVGAEQP